MNREDTLSLIHSAQAGDEAAAQALVETNTGLVWSVVRRFYNRGVEPDDLYQLGCLGLVKAIQGFDGDFGTQFSTYAVPKIAGEIRRFLRDDGAVKVSRGLKERSQRLAQARLLLQQRLGREPTLSELSEETALAVEDIATAETATGAVISLQEEAGEERARLEDFLGDDGQEEKLLERFALQEAIGRLPDQERRVISLRYFHDLTQDKTAQIIGVSQVQVSRLEKKAVRKLQTLLL